MVSLACPAVSSGWQSQHRIFPPKKKKSNPHHENQKRPRQHLSKMVQGVPPQASTSKVTVLPVNVLTKISIFYRIDWPTAHLPTHKKETSLNHEAAKHDESIDHSFSQNNTTSEHREYQNPYPECQNAWALLSLAGKHTSHPECATPWRVNPICHQHRHERKLTHTRTTHSSFCL